MNCPMHTSPSPLASRPAPTSPSVLARLMGGSPALPPLTAAVGGVHGGGVRAGRPVVEPHPRLLLHPSWARPGNSDVLLLAPPLALLAPPPPPLLLDAA